MYKIYKDNKVIATVETPTYIRKHPTEPCYTSATAETATGIAVQGLGVFALMGNELDELAQVVVVESDGGMAIDEIDADIKYVAETLDVPVIAEMTDKDRAIAQTNRWLRRELKKGMEWVDGKVYNVSEKKQGLLQAQLLIGSMQAMNGVNPAEITLQWNESGKAHTEWEYLKLCQLANDIHAYVEPLVTKQQQAEELINEAENNEEIETILAEFT